MAEIQWIKSGRCESNACVEAAQAGDQVLVRDSKQGDGAPFLSFTSDQWREFVGDAKAGKFDIPD